MKLTELLEIKSGYKPMVECGCDLKDIYKLGEEKSRIDASSVLGVGALHDFIGGQNGTIHYIDMQQYKEHQDIFDTTIYVHQDKTFDVIIPLHAIFITQRYKMIHEYAHYVLHSDKGMCYACHRGNNDIEKEANTFALGFLMPAKLFEAKQKKYNNNINSLVIAFLVPPEIIKDRITLQEKYGL
ncbi:MAG: ImmA/IrrE family metallo-endopeptidase [Planctomycetaceae bacterium]|jgi:hypothetical protein|nr:ImmA/IrrE family metallo-endopeptidase [Planctomycetaceae bacterium]